MIENTKQEQLDSQSNSGIDNSNSGTKLEMKHTKHIIYDESGFPIGEVIIPLQEENTLI
jgi:hypothetical protein